MADAAAPGASSTEDDELTLPRASINKMIKEILPHIRVANESRELILNCCTEFIHLISSEANEICNKQQKKTINADHVLQGTYFWPVFYMSVDCMCLTLTLNIFISSSSRPPGLQ